MLPKVKTEIESTTYLVQVKSLITLNYWVVEMKDKDFIDSTGEI